MVTLLFTQFLGVLSVSASSTLGSAQSGTVVSIISDKNEVGVGDFVSLTVHIENAIDLYGASVEISYDPNLLEPVEVLPSEPNILFPPTTEPDSEDAIYERVIEPQPRDNGQNIWTYLRTRLYDYSGVGTSLNPASGNLVTFKFRAINEGTVNLTVGNSYKDAVRVQLSNSSEQPIPFTGTTSQIELEIRTVPLTLTIDRINEDHFTNQEQLTISGTTLAGVELTTSLTNPSGTNTSPQLTVDENGSITGNINLTQEGEYRLSVTAEPIIGYIIEGNEEITFTYDQTNPQITITGVEDGKTYDRSRTPVIDVDEVNIKEMVSTLTKNSTSPISFVSRTEIRETGEYFLEVTVEDKAGNVAEKQVRFAIVSPDLLEKLEVLLNGSEDGTIPGLKTLTNAEYQQIISDLIELNNILWDDPNILTADQKAALAASDLSKENISDVLLILQNTDFDDLRNTNDSDLNLFSMIRLASEIRKEFPNLESKLRNRLSQDQLKELFFGLLDLKFSSINELTPDGRVSKEIVDLLVETIDMTEEERRNWSAMGLNFTTMQRMLDAAEDDLIQSINRLFGMLGFIELDVNAPSISEIQPASDSFINNSTPVISVKITEGESGSGIDSRTIYMEINGEEVIPQYNASTGTVTYTPNAPLEDGVTSVYLSVADLSGNVGERAWTFTIDTVAELTTAFHDAFGPLKEGDSYQVIASGEPGAMVTVKQSDTIETTTLTEVGEEIYSHTFTIAPGDDYSGIFTVELTDRAGNSTSMATESILIDTIAPVISNPGYSIVDDILSVSFKPSDPADNKLVATFSVGSYIQEVIMVYNATNGKYEGSISLEDLDFSNELITIFVQDIVGHDDTEDIGPITVDHTPPVVTLSRISGEKGLRNIYKTEVQLKLETEQNASIHYVLTEDTTRGNEQTVNTNSTTIPLNGEHDYTLEYWGVDQAGNASEPKTYSIKVDTIKPEVPNLVFKNKENVINVNNPIKVGQVSITASTNEANADIQLWVNGQPKGHKKTGETFTGIVLQRGENRIVAKASDQAGNESIPQEISINYDDVAPVFNIQVDKTTTPNKIIATTNDSDIKNDTVKATVKIDTGTANESILIDQEMTNTGQGIYEFTTDLSYVKSLHIEVKAADNADNTSSTIFEEQIVSSSEGGQIGNENTQLDIEGGDLPEDGTVLVVTEETDNPNQGETPAGNTVSVVYTTVSGNQDGALAEDQIVVGTFRYPVPDGWDPDEYERRFRFKVYDEETEQWFTLGEDESHPNGWYEVVIEPDPDTDDIGPYTLVVTMHFKHFSKYAGFVDITPPDLTASLSVSVVNNINKNFVTLTGTTEVGASVAVSLNGEIFTPSVNSGGQFTLSINPVDWVDNQINSVLIEASDSYNNTASQTIVVEVDMTVPATPQITTPENNEVYTNRSTITISGTAEVGSTVKVLRNIGSNPVASGLVGQSGNFSFIINLNANSLNAFRITTTDDAENVSSPITRNVIHDTIVPNVTLSNAPTVVPEREISLSGRISESLSSLTVSVNNRVATAATLNNVTQTFTAGSLLLDETPGLNAIVFTATDLAGNKSTLVYQVTYNPAAPTIILDAIDNLTNNPQLTISGTSAQGANVTIKLNGVAVKVIPALPENGRFTATVTLIENENAIEVIAIKNGVGSSEVRNITLDTIPPEVNGDFTVGPIINDKVSISGEFNEAIQTLLVNGTVYTASLNEDQKSFTVNDISVPNLNNSITMVATDMAGNTESFSLNVVNESKRSTSPPSGPIGPIGSGPATGEATPAQGGTISYDNGNVVLTIPAGAVAQDIDVTIDAFELTDEQKAALAKVFGSAVTITSATTDTKQNVSTFGRALTITFKYSASSLGGTNESELKVAYWHEGLKTWVLLPTVVANGEASAPVSHFTTFALITTNSDVPQANFVKQVSTNSVSITGTASANATVHVFINGKMLVVTKADENGKYDVTAGPLKAGINSVFVHDHNKNAASIEKIVTYIPTSLSDIATHWAKQSIGALVQLGVIAGYPDGKFKPEQSVTRAEFIAMVVRAAGIPVDMNADVSNFADASELGWAKPYVAAAYKLGLVSGYQENGKTYFKPNKTINRAEIAVFVSRAIQLLRLPAPTGNGVVFNEELPVWAKAEIELAAKYGIITGYEDRTFKALKTATRAETATMIIRMLNLVK